jgi:MSHA biogenesis protein MshP
VAGGAAARQQGFSLVAAIFLIVVLAALGTFAVRMAMSQYQSADLVLLEARAQAAADAGLEYAANRALRAGGCGAVGASVALSAPDLSRYVVTLRCAAVAGSGVNRIKPNGGPSQPYVDYQLSATATHGAYGQFDYVSRTTARIVTNAPP